MNKYDNYVYLAICEASLETFKKTNFVTYASYCKSLGISFKTNTLSSSEKRQIGLIFDSLELLFGMNAKEMARYIVKYFDLDSKYLIKFEKTVMLTKELFPLTGG